MVEDYSEPRRKRNRAARERYEARQRRRETMVSIRQESTSKLSRFNLPLPNGEWRQQFWMFLKDAGWYLRKNPITLQLVGLIAFIGILTFFLSYGLAGKIAPNIWALNAPLGGLTRSEAESRLISAWNETASITLMLENDALFTVEPEALGLRLNLEDTLDSAYGAGFSGIPFGVNIAPSIELDYGTAQSYLLNLTEDVYIAPYEAGYVWRDGELVGVQGRSSRELDVTLTLERLSQSADTIVKDGRFELITSSTQPNIVDPSPYLQDAYVFSTQQFRILGYDPFLNESVPWTTTDEELTRWLAAGPNGLTLREDAFREFIAAINSSLNSSENPRYLDDRESIAAVQQAIAAGTDSALLRIRYLPTTYTIEQGDNGFRIGRKTGLPFQLINDANPGLEWGELSIGQVINLPSRDTLLPEDPIAHKRIIVDLDRQWLIAYENGQQVFSWAISSGREEAPTYPGTFQILTKNDVAYGSGFSLCGDNGCDQWEMYNFMGIYEVTPGLMNGFHGAVLLPNGAYLGGGGVDHPSTFGCVMSENSNSLHLYEWAELGTIVEIISSEYLPESDIAREAQAYMQANAF